MAMHVKKGDTVMVIAARTRAPTGKVIAAYPEQDRVIVEGVNLVKKHTKIGQTNRGAKTGGIITQRPRSTCRTSCRSSRSTARTSRPASATACEDGRRSGSPRDR